MYICKDEVCDPCCDFCWYCIHGKYGQPAQCEKDESGFSGGLGYCDRFKCRLHEEKPIDKAPSKNAVPHTSQGDNVPG